MTDKRVDELTEETSPASDDLLYLEKASSNLPRKLQVGNLPSSDGGIQHIALDISFDTPGLSSPSGDIPGVVLYTPAVGDILFDGWIETVTAWNGGAPGQFADFFLQSGTGVAGGGGNGAFGNTPGLGIPALNDVDAGDVFAGPGYNNFRASQPTGNAMLSALDLVVPFTSGDAANYQRIIPGKWFAVDPLVLVVSSDGTAIGNDPGATQGELIVHLLVIPA